MYILYIYNTVVQARVSMLSCRMSLLHDRGVRRKKWRPSASLLNSFWKTLPKALVLSKSPQRQYFHKLKLFWKSNEISMKSNCSCISHRLVVLLIPTGPAEFGACYHPCDNKNKPLQKYPWHQPPGLMSVNKQGNHQHNDVLSQEMWVWT